MKRVLSVQDLSCVGKCSLTVALPILSAAGLETSILPIAVLSAHTQFPGFTFRDLTPDLLPITEHWKKQSIGFAGIYSGYLGSAEQITFVKKLFRDFNTPEQLHFVDPAMADNGQLYTGFSHDFAKNMSSLCSEADIIVPNLTEAAFMLGEEFPGNDYTEADLQGLLRRLCGLGCRTAVITGVSISPGQCGAIGFDAADNTFFSYFSEQLPVSFHGTGDVFSSAFFAALMLGFNLQESLRIAVEYTVESIRQTIKVPNPTWYGVDFELAIPTLLKLLNIR